MILLPAAILLFVAFTLGLSLIVATANTFYRDCGHLVTVFFQAWYFATPILYRAEDFPAATQWRFRLNPAYYFIELFHDIVYFGTMAAVQLMASRHRDRAGEPGDRICHIQVARRQDGIPTLSRTARGRETAHPRPVPLIELRDVSLRFINYADKQYSLQARGARPGAPARVAGSGLRVLGLAEHQPADRPRRTRRHRRRQRSRQEHAAAAPGADLSADLGHGRGSGQRRPLDRDGRRLQFRVVRL